MVENPLDFVYLAPGSVIPISGLPTNPREIFSMLDVK